DRAVRRTVRRQARAAAPIALVACVLACGGAPDAPKHQEAAMPSHESRKANHLAGQTSPYLLQHRFNPVDWYPWGPEALAKAKSENKPIFLSIGYAACHWCH